MDDSVVTSDPVATNALTPPRRRRWPRRVGVGGGLVGLLVVVAVALLPTLAGSKVARGLIASQINGRIPGSVSIAGITARWRGGQRIEGVALRDPQGVEVLTLGSLDLPDAGLWGLVRGARDLGAVTLTGLRLEVVKDAQGRTNLEKALGSGGAGAERAGEEVPDDAPGDANTAENTGDGLEAWGVDLTLSDVVVGYREPGRAPLGVTLSTGWVALDKGGVQANFESAVTVGQGQGMIAGAVEGGLDALASRGWTGSVAAVDLPLAAIDLWVGADGYLAAALGDLAGFTVSLDQWSPDTGGGIVVSAATAAGTGGELRLIDDGQTLRLSEEATFALVQTPELSDKITRLINPVLMPAVVSATQPLKITLDPEAFSIGSRGFDWSAVHAGLRLDVGTVAVLPSREPFAGLVQQLQSFGFLKAASLYDLEVQPIALTIAGGEFRYLPQHYKLDDVTLTFDGVLSMTDRVLDVRLVPGGREIERDPLIRSLVGAGVKISGTLDDPTVELGALTDAFSKEKISDTLFGALGGLLQRELGKKDRPSEDEGEDAAR